MPVGNPKLNAKNTNAQICAISQTEAAEMLNVSRRAVQLAAKVQTEAAPEVVEAVKNGPLDGVGEGRPDLYQSVQIGVILTAIVFDCAGFCARVSRNRGFWGLKGRVFKSCTAHVCLLYGFISSSGRLWFETSLCLSDRNLYECTVWLQERCVIGTQRSLGRIPDAIARFELK